MLTCVTHGEVVACSCHKPHKEPLTWARKNYGRDDIQSRYERDLSANGRAIYDYWFELAKPVEEKPGQAASLALEKAKARQRR